MVKKQVGLMLAVALVAGLVGGAVSSYFVLSRGLIAQEPLQQASESQPIQTGKIIHPSLSFPSPLLFRNDAPPPSSQFVQAP